MSDSKKLSKDAFNDIRKMIFLGKFSPGQSIAYRKMAEELDMSLTPVVQALKVMEHMGVIRHETNRGFFVEQITPQEVTEAYQLREIIELNLIEDCINNLDEDGEIALKLALGEFFETSQHSSEKARLAKDISFHMTIATLSAQNISVWILRYIYDLLYLRFDKGLILYQSNDHSNEEHQAIFDAIIARDVSKAKMAVTQHIHNISNNTLNSMHNLASEIEDVDI